MKTNQPIQTLPAKKIEEREPPIGEKVEIKAQDNLVSSYLRIFREFRRRDLKEFCDRHEALYREALRNQNHLAVTQHYYGLMADVIETYYGDGWHFCAPERAGQNRADATMRMYDRVSDYFSCCRGIVPWIWVAASEECCATSPVIPALA